jgi:hypothetical protein
MAAHKCFGCGKELRDYDAHIHVPLEQWGAEHGAKPLGLDGELGDLLTFAFCEDCTEGGGNYELESHELGEPS